MNEKHRGFKSKDIGGELLPIITKGIYPDHRDALREYIQNAIDANATNVRVVILGSTIMIEDDGDGMILKQAEDAIRIGLSDKQPDKQVGFRGVGIYSSYDLSSRLEIITVPKDGSSPSRMTFDWNSIKGKLLAEHASRLEGRPARLSLEELLTNSVFVTEENTNVLPSHGTKVIIAGVDPILMKLFSERDGTIKYLQDAVSLPFSPDFRHGALITEWLSNAGIKTIRVFLKVDSFETEVLRPYRDEAFSQGNPNEPIKTDLYDRFSKKSHGFAWVCFNDANAYLPHVGLRGILLKKMGFSVGARLKLEPLFPRVVFSRRSTGEAIILNKQLLPNAARSDFEPGPEKDSLDRALVKLVSEISTQGNRLQNTYKTLEWLNNASVEITNIDEAISAGKVAGPELNLYSSKINILLSELRRHRKIANQLDDAKVNWITERLGIVNKAISELTAHAKKQAVDTVQKQIKAAKERTKDEARARPPQMTISKLANTAGPQSVQETLSWIDFLDDQIKAIVEPVDYQNLVEVFSELLEGATE